MISRSLVVTALLLVTIPVDAPAADRWRYNSGCRCPQTSAGWMLFADSSYGTPDFWWTDSVSVEEISICNHGVQFVFTTRQEGTLHRTALVFPKPTRVVPVHSLDLSPGRGLSEREFNHFRRRFDALTHSLEEISGGALTKGARMSFFEASAVEPPVIVPRGLLELRWRGVVLKLRGDLDVYFTLMA